MSAQLIIKQINIMNEQINIINLPKSLVNSLGESSIGSFGLYLEKIGFID